MRKPIFPSPTVTHRHTGLCQVPGLTHTHTHKPRKLSQRHRWHLAPAKHIEATQPPAGRCPPAHSMPTSVHTFSPLQAVAHSALFSNRENLVWHAFRHLHETQLLLQWQIHLLGMRQQAAQGKEPTQGKSTEVCALRIRAEASEPVHSCDNVTLACFLQCTCSHVPVSPQSESTFWVPSAGFSAPWQLNIYNSKTMKEFFHFSVP